MYSFMIEILSNFSIFFFLLLPEKSSAAHFKYEACAPRTCGNLSIKYPFYIQGLQESYCGFPGFELNCSNSRRSPIIHIPDNDYVIGDIFYENQTFRVHNEAVSRISNCLPQINNITLPDQFGLLDASANLHLLLNCNKSILKVLRKYRKVACDYNNNKDRSWVLAMLQGDENLNRALEECERNVLAPVEVVGNDHGTNGLMDYEGLLRRGFVLKWKAFECSTCQESGGRCGFNSSSYQSLCFCPDKPHHVRCRSRKTNWKLVLGIVMAGVAAVFIFMVVFLISRPKNGINVAWYFPSRNISDPSPPDLEGGSVYFGVPVFSYSELEEATNNFDASKELGDGGFGTVYFGKLCDGREVAVKRLYEHNFKRMEQFMNEIEILTRLRHRNLVTLYVDISRHRHEINLASLAINRIQRCEFDELLDPSLGYKSDTEILRMTTSVAELAFRCLQLEKDMRPKMEEVLETLKEIQNCKDILVDKKTKTNENTIESRRAMVTSRQSGDIALLNSVNFPSSPSSVADQRVSSSTTTSASG
ncbi:hypothetical protein ACH5RR_030123 [Cinchona calisaya]|uniref:non-specific serine/threonine protein kinase n=1 Tax=Cinchona calisaya TaxID=153742 RepID=A0ABD2YY04_9GENT